MADFKHKCIKCLNLIPDDAVQKSLNHLESKVPMIEREKYFEQYLKETWLPNGMYNEVIHTAQVCISSSDNEHIVGRPCSYS